MKQLTRLTLVCAVLLLGDVTLTSSSVKADAICQDGWYSSSEGSGTCSHHGGVSQWIDNSPVISDSSLPDESPNNYLSISDRYTNYRTTYFATGSHVHFVFTEE